jgi:hypothetical protein
MIRLRLAMDLFAGAQLGAVNRRDRAGKQVGLAAELHEGTADAGDGVGVVAAEIGDGLEVGTQGAQQPAQFQVDQAGFLQPPG